MCVPQLALDDDHRHALVRQLDRVRVAQLMRRQPPAGRWDVVTFVSSSLPPCPGAPPTDAPSTETVSKLWSSSALSAAELNQHRAIPADVEPFTLPPFSASPRPLTT